MRLIFNIVRALVRSCERALVRFGDCAPGSYDNTSARAHESTIVRNQKGVALLIVLSALAVLTTAVVEFTYHSRINYKLAVNTKQRLQAFYLAKSSYNLSMLLLKYNKQAESMMEKAQENIEGFQMEPLYRMMPLSSELLRGMAGGQLDALFGGEDEGDEGSEDESGLEDSQSELEDNLNYLEREEIEKFLDFEGDFSSEITEEQIKYDLNRVFGIETTSKTYDNIKKMLRSILMLPQFVDYFEEINEPPDQIVHALTDWVDLNGMINEYDNLQRGSEDSLYSDLPYKPKNGKFMTVSEMRLVAGITDEIYKKLSPFVTVYTKSEKINACLAGDEMTKALIYHYTNHAGCTAGVSYEEEEKMEEYVSEMLSGCPNPEDMAVAINTKLGLADLQASSGTTKKKKGKPGSTVAGCAFQLKDFLTDENNIFKIQATGTVDETNVVITTVLNTKEKNPKRWKTYYYRVE
jgi:type II secretory pathway component PulK